MSDLHDQKVIDSERELVTAVGISHAVAAAQQQLVSWEELPDGSMEAMADRRTFERAAVAHSLAAGALLGDDVTTELRRFGPLTQAQACLEALERGSQCVFLDDSGRAAMLAERVVATISDPEPSVLPALLIPGATPVCADESGLPGAMFRPGDLDNTKRFTLRLLAAKLTTLINPDDGATLRAWMADVAQLMGVDNSVDYASFAIRLFAATRAVHGLNLGETLVEVTASLTTAAQQIPQMRKRSADGEWLED
jgi:hypothetical protein